MRLIDADEAVERANASDKIVGSSIWETSEVVEFLEDCPTVDAVPVVRCKDCKHSVWDEENEMWKCVESAEFDEDVGEWFGFYEYHNGNFFCAYGERKDK